MNFNEGYPEECSSVPDVNEEERHEAEKWYHLDDPRIFDEDAQIPDFCLNIFNGFDGDMEDWEIHISKLFKNFLDLPTDKRQSYETASKLLQLLGHMTNEDERRIELLKEKKKRGRPTKEKVAPPPPEPKILKTADKKAYNKEYNEKYYQKRKEKNETIICNICNGRYNKFSKAKHDLTNNHIFILNKLNKNNEI
jgi:rubrerythrin